jgi:membrane protein required for colicin V production
MALTALDMLVLVMMGGGGVLGLLRGFVTEILSLAVWVAAVFAVKIGHAPATAALEGPVGTQAGAAVLAFALLFGVVFIGGRFLARSIGARTRSSVLGPVDRVLGFGFGAVKGLVLVTMLFLAANLVTDTFYGGDAERPDWMRDSRSFTLLNASSRAIVDFVEMRRDEAKPEAAGDGNRL